MKTGIYSVVAISLIVLFSGCQSFFEAPSKASRNERAIRKLTQRINKQNRLLRRQMANTAESTAYYEEQIKKLNARIDYLNDNYDNMLKIINELRALIAQKGQNTKALEQELQKLRGELTKERQLRKQEMSKVVDVITKETSSAINKIVRQQRRRASSRGKGPAGSGEFYIYTVQKGATLSAIAKAYKVSIEEIKRINKLKGYMIRVGQKLYIPKK